MYIVYNEWDSLDYGKWDWESIVKQWHELIEEYGIQLIGRGEPVGTFDWVNVYLSDLEPIMFSEFLGKSVTFNGKKLARTKTTVVLSKG
jgi:hypothetical protein